MSLVESWLAEPPHDDLFETWCEYVKGLADTMTAESFAKLKHDVMGQAKQVAHAAGGFLGVINSESQSEKRVLDKLGKSV